MPASDEVEIQSADPAVRRRALMALVLLAVAGAIGIWALEQRLASIEQLAIEDHEAARLELESVVRTVGWILGVGLAALAAWMVMLGIGILRSDRFPPPSARLVQDTYVRRGDAATRYALGAFFVAALLALSAIGLPVMLTRLVDLLR